MFAGDVTTGRLLPFRVRARLGIPFLLLLATPYLLFALRPSVTVAAVLVAVASIGFGSSLIQQERLPALIPDELSGHALGLHTAGMLTMQGMSAALAGGIAQLASPGTAMTVMAAASVAVTLTLAPSPLRRRTAAPGRQHPESSAPRERQSEVNST
jgi:predicted MFS family arabinose efflux permease